MHVLVVTSLFPPHSYGGYETSCADVVQRWRERGHRVTVLTTDVRLDGVPEVTDEVDVRRELSWYWVDHRIPERTWRERVAVERHNAEVLAEVVDEARPDVVSAWAMGALSLGLLNRVVDRALPLVLVLGDDWLSYGERVDMWRRPLAGHRWRAALASLVTRLPSAFPEAGAVTAVYCSDAVRSMAEAAPWRPASGVVVSPGVDLRDFPLVPSPPDRPWSWRLLQVGRLDPRKGLGVSVEALLSLPVAARLDVVGRGDPRYARELGALADRLGVAVRVGLRGGLPRARLAAVYDAADVALFPVVWDEPFGIVPLEAMARGTPVVATGTGGSGGYLVDGVNCLLVPPGDAVSLAAAVRRLAEDPGLRRRVVEGGLVTAAEHTADRYADRLEVVHEQAAGP